MSDKDDCISRRAALDTIMGQPPEPHYPSWYAAQIEKLPSAQPESCVNTIDALNESIKHFDDMAEECRRNANIERNDYMDMRDDSAEYRQLSIWLNELKWLRERFQSQPEIVRCKDCKYRDPEDKKCDCGHDIRWQLPRHDDWFCADAERRTDE